MKNDILSKNILDVYDYIALKNTVLNIFDLFDYLKVTDDKICIPRITSDNKIRYEQFTGVKNSSIENCIIKNMMLDVLIEDKRKKLLSKVTLALKKLNHIETKVFDLSFYKKVEDCDIAFFVNYGIDKMREIRKSACVKFLLSLGLAMDCIK